MTIARGTRLGSYEILSPLGAGGMGEVYRARDVRVDRAVALKVLPEEFFESEERRQRFEREARMLASLNHPGIAVLYSFEEIPGTSSSSSRHLLVMELVEGEDLGQRLASGPLPLEESLSYAKQIAEALEAAHEKGIVHRDLKPANVKVTPDGRVKLLDFGLAKIFEGDGDSSKGGSGGGLTQSPTLTARATAAGVILGTAAYMSPEQARGKLVDKRTDVWAFGCVLFEMLTGKRAFEGESVSDTLAAVLMKEPDWAALPERTPAAVKRILRRCLQRDARLRLHDIADARLDLEEAGASASSSSLLPFEEKTAAPSPTVGRSASASRERGSKISRILPWAIAAACAAAAGALALRARAPQAAGLLARSALLPPEGATFSFGGTQPGPPSVSPDGTRIVSAARRQDGSTQLWVRPLGSEDWVALSGTEKGSYPFWSPDGRSIAFFADGKLKRIEAGGGPPLTLCDAPYGKGGTWSEQGTILFAPSYDSGLQRVPAEGGQAKDVTMLDRGHQQNSHRFPQFLPDGRHFIFVVRVSGEGADEVMVGSLEGGPPRPLVKASGNAAFVSGRLLYVRDRALVARRFDPDSLRLEGEEAVIGDDVHVFTVASLAVFSASRTGTLVYDRGPGSPVMALRWFDRSGREAGSVGEPGPYHAFALAPDGRRAALSAEDPKTGRLDVLILDVARGVAERLTSGKSDSSMPLWRPDGKALIFRAREGGLLDLWEKNLDGVTDKTLLLKTDKDKEPTDVSPDGRTLAFGVSNLSIWMLPLTPAGPPYPYLQSGFNEENARFSPDGRWVAFESTEAGRKEVYVTSFPKPGAHVRISSGGGQSPRWSVDGRELFFLTPGNTLMSAALRSERGAALEVRAPARLFDVPSRVFGSDLALGQSASYDVRGDRFLFLVETGTRDRHPLTLVTNWTAAFARP